MSAADARRVTTSSDFATMFHSLRARPRCCRAASTITAELKRRFLDCRFRRYGAPRDAAFIYLLAASFRRPSPMSPAAMPTTAELAAFHRLLAAFTLLRASALAYFDFIIFDGARGAAVAAEAAERRPFLAGARISRPQGASPSTHAHAGCACSRWQARKI